MNRRESGRARRIQVVRHCAGGARGAAGGKRPPAGDGVRLNSEAPGARVLGNLIGTTHTGTGRLGNGNGGIFSSATGPVIGGEGPGEANVVAFNGADEVTVVIPGTGNRILRNALFANGGEGIDLGNDGSTDGPTDNVPGDFDGGANSLQNKPEIIAATSGRVRGTLHSTPNATFAIRVYSSPSEDEAKDFRGGPVRITTDDTGNATLSVPTTSPIPTGHRVTATATGASGTSEFSAAVPVPT